MNSNWKPPRISVTHISEAQPATKSFKMMNLARIQARYAKPEKVIIKPNLVASRRGADENDSTASIARENIFTNVYFDSPAARCRA